MGKKVEQDAAANIRSLAARNGRNAELAQSAVIESRSFTAGRGARERADRPGRATTSPDLLEALDGRAVIEERNGARSATRAAQHRATSR